MMELHLVTCITITSFLPRRETYRQSNNPISSCTGKSRCRSSPCFTDQETQEENLQGGTSSLVGRFLHPVSPVQSSRSIQRMQTAQMFLNRILILCRQFVCRTSLCFTDQETQEENFQGGTNSLVGQFLHPISLVQSSRSFQRMQPVQLFLNTF